MNTIRRLCDRCIVLDQGKVIYDGEVEGAIAVYMDHAVGENETDMDLAESSVPPASEPSAESGTLYGASDHEGKDHSGFAREETLD